MVVVFIGRKGWVDFGKRRCWGAEAVNVGWKLSRWVGRGGRVRRALDVGVVWQKTGKKVRVYHSQANYPFIIVK